MAAKIESIDVDGTLNKARLLMEEEQGIPPSVRAIMELLLLLISLMANRLNLNSRNSSKPPSTDPHRLRSQRKSSGRKPGGQPKHVGTTLKRFDDPDVTQQLLIDRNQFPISEYRHVGFERRQVVDIDFVRSVTEFQAEIVKDSKGNRFVATFPDGVTAPIQYGPRIKAHAVYLSQYQMIPYQRVRDYFAQQVGIPVSAGSLRNFNQAAFDQLESFEARARQELAASKFLHADETGININGARHWLHVVANDLWVHFSPHIKRGQEAMKAAGILPVFKGVLIHDHWKPYYAISDEIKHALCNAHHIRELTRAWEQDGEQWAEEMMILLKDLNKEVDSSGGVLAPDKANVWRNKYQLLLEKAEVECPPPDPAKRKGKRGRQKRSKARNLLERLRDFEDDVLRFMVMDYVPFTNNQGENDLRMTKVQQKVSGCFRSMEGAQTFSRVRSYLLTCQRQNISASDALNQLFDGKLPEFAASS